GNRNSRRPRRLARPVHRARQGRRPPRKVRPHRRSCTRTRPPTPPPRRYRLTTSSRYSCVMRPLRYSINVTLDGCCDHRAGIADEDLHRHAAENIAQSDALLFGRVIYEMMESAWRPVAETGVKPEWMADCMVPFAGTIHAAKKYVVSSTLDHVDWNAELVRGDLA